jgi:hypothetical protein
MASAPGASARRGRHQLVRDDPTRDLGLFVLRGARVGVSRRSEAVAALRELRRCLPATAAAAAATPPAPGLLAGVAVDARPAHRGFRGGGGVIAVLSILLGERRIE